MMVLGSLQQQAAAALYWPLRSFPGLATPAAEAAQCDSERLEVWGLSATLWASAADCAEAGHQCPLVSVPLAPGFPVCFLLVL